MVRPRLADLARATLFAPLSGGFALAARLRAFVVRAAARLGKYAILLDFAVKAFERLLKRISWIYFYFTHKLLPTRSSIITSARLLRLIAIITINRFVAAGLERHLRLVTAVRANNGIHLARFARATIAAAVSTTGGLPFARGTAFWTTARSIRQIMTGVKFLLTNGEDEFLIAIAATQGLITQ
jgi:hypothetical protein